MAKKKIDCDACSVSCEISYKGKAVIECCPFCGEEACAVSATSKPIPKTFEEYDEYDEYDEDDEDEDYG